MKKTSNKRNSNTEFEIKKAALHYISKYGYEGTTLKDIAQTVGIKTPSIYSHFDSKEQLFISLLKDLRIKDREGLMKHVLSLRNKSIEEVFKNLFFYYTDANNIVFWVIALKEILMHPTTDIVQNLREGFTELEREISIQLTELFQIGRNEGWIKRKDTELMISLFFTLIDGLLVEQSLYDDKKYEERRKEMWNLYRQIITQ
ncbi:TetR/AcrR family transcriptional regulator [Siminovitchia sp. 179-K 8D1 HS]|uniref:TetR/AcrR family transcriptional regulator n=1 Tax=Siminovitchia sp. 179-K 8D1 HS TaxID=3142385 RepID=UPI00399F1209